QRGSRDTITDWTDPTAGASWELQASADGKYLVQLHTSCSKKGAVIMLHGAGKHACQVPQTENNRTFATIKAGEMALKKGQKVSLRLEAVADGWQPVSVALVELVPQN
ncbi:MAG TPA: hypothetical protein VFY13_04690, partial [Luteolibacter sp.]|nr:hypothetical protein [Luteolibacter sp.]